MSQKPQGDDRSKPTLGQHLAAIRKDRGLSLRQVEELTKKQISNPYLNQIETGKIQQPSPNILYTLSEIYRTSYQFLMELAGYVSGTPEKAPQYSRASTFSELNLTVAEEKELLQYLDFIREKGRRNAS